MVSSYSALGRRTAGGKHLRVLHLEDDPADVLYIHLQLKKHGITSAVTSVATRAAFETELDRACYDLIISDSNIPTFDGAVALSMAVRKCPFIPFIFVAGFATDEDMARAKSAGAAGYVLKSDVAALIQLVRQAAAWSPQSTIQSALLQGRVRS